MPEPEQRQQIEPIHHRRGELSAWEPQMYVLNHLKVLKNIDLWTLHPKIFTLGPEHIYIYFLGKHHSTEDDKLGQLASENLPRGNLFQNMLGKELISEIKSTSYKSLESSQTVTYEENL